MNQLGIREMLTCAPCIHEHDPLLHMSLTFSYLRSVFSDISAFILGFTVGFSPPLEKSEFSLLYLSYLLSPSSEFPNKTWLYLKKKRKKLIVCFSGFSTLLGHQTST